MLLVVPPTDYWDAWPIKLTAAEAAEILRIKHMDTMYDWLHAGYVPAHRLGGAWVIFRDPLRASVDNGRPEMVYPDAYWDTFPEVMDAKELAEFIGLSYSATLRMLKTGEPISVKRGRSLMVTKDNAIAFMRKHANRPT